MINPLKIIHSLAEIPTGYTVFEKDQVLTDKQLNGITAYLGGQDRLTRIELLGVGIVAGLRPRLAGEKIIISKGVGTPTNGDLMVLPEHMSFDRFRPYGGSAPFYEPFCINGKQIEAFELLREGKKLAPVNECSGNTQPLSSFEKLAEMVVVMLMESCENNHDLCSCCSCDNMGRDAANTMRFLLVSRSDAHSLRHRLATYRERARGLPEIFAERPLLTPDIATTYQLADLYREACKEIHLKLIDGFEKLYKIFPGIVRNTFEGGSDPGLISLLNRRQEEFISAFPAQPDTGSPEANIFPPYFQYHYDFLKDLVETWNAMREALLRDDSVLCPDVTAFPKHLLLGDLSYPDQLRTGFYPSPLTACSCNAREHALFLAKKLRALIYAFEVPGMTQALADAPKGGAMTHMDTERQFAGKYSRFTASAMRVRKVCLCRCRKPDTGTSATEEEASLPIVITPSHTECAELEERAIPYYYAVTEQFPIHRRWNYRLSMRGEETLNLGYWAPAYQGLPQDPLKYQIGHHDFFRIEGHLGQDILEVMAQLKRDITAKNLPIAVCHFLLGDPAKALLFNKPSLRESICTSLARLQSFLKDWYEKIKGQEGMDAAIADNMAAINDAIELILKKLPGANYEQYSSGYSALNKIMKMIAALGKSSASVDSSFLGNLKEILASFSMKQFKGQELAYTKLLFQDFFNMHPGEHFGGVVRGGTFVLVYDESQRVVADFMLPYRIQPEIKATAVAAEPVAESPAVPSNKEERAQVADGKPVPRKEARVKMAEVAEIVEPVAENQAKTPEAPRPPTEPVTETPAVKTAEVLVQASKERLIKAAKTMAAKKSLVKTSTPAKRIAGAPSPATKKTVTQKPKAGLGG